MKVTEELLKEKKKTDLNFSDGIILPDGDYRPISKGGHLHRLIPEDDSPLFWLIEKTGCVLTDYNNSLGMKMTAEQQRVFDAMRRHGFITDDYYDLTKQREKVRKEREEKSEK